jgi:hypothetical protein
MSPRPRLPTPSFGGWHDYQLWAEHGFRPRGPEDDPVPEGPQPDEAHRDEAEQDEADEAGAVEDVIEWPSRHDTQQYLDDPLPDDDTSLLVRPYTRTGGRTHGCYELALETLVSVTEFGRQSERHLTGDHRLISHMCANLVSVSEIAAGLRAPVNVVQVLIGDMARDELVFIHRGDPMIGDRPSAELMQRVLDGLRAL